MFSRSSSSDVLALMVGALLLAGCAGPGRSSSLRDWGEKNVVVLPIENLSGESAPLGPIRETLIRALKGRGFTVRDDATSEAVLARYRVRYTGGVDGETAQRLRSDLQASAVLVTSLERYREDAPCGIGLVCRLVSTGEHPRILWMDSIDLGGDDSPGVLELGVVSDPAVLRQRAARSLAESLASHLEGAEPSASGAAGGERSFPPKVRFRSPLVPEGRPCTVVVLPLFNRSARKNADRLLGLHLVEEFTKVPGFDVVEPGVVRDKLLNIRFIMTEGLSLADAELIANSLGADLVVTGTVREYEDQAGSAADPRVDFSLTVLDRASRRVVWSSKSYRGGGEGVFFYDWRRVRAAGALAKALSRSIVESLAGAKASDATAEPAPAVPLGP